MAAEGGSGILSSLGGNQLFGAGIGIVAFGAGLAILRKFNQRFIAVFHRYYMMSMEVTSMDVSYPWLLSWLMKRSYGTTQHIGINTKLTTTESGMVKASFDTLPGPGVHYFWYKWQNKRKLLWFERERESQTFGKNRSMFETVKLQAFGRDMRLFPFILSEARADALHNISGKTIIYHVAGSEWRPFGHPRRKRNLSTIVLDYGVVETIRKDVQDFCSNQKWYVDRGIPYRRGYLLYGPPGCGKTSFITALAGELDYGICILNLAQYGLSDDRLQHLLSVAPPDTIILLEDVDAAAAGRDLEKQDPRKYEGMGSLTSSGLLNALDGVASSEQRIIFMTTNHIEKLNPAMIRPGRVDFRQEISFASPYQIKNMFQRFYDCELSLCEDFLQKLDLHSKDFPEHRHITTAQLQAYFLFHKLNPNDAINNIDRMWSS